MEPALLALTERVRAAAADHTRLRIQGGGSKAAHPLSPRDGALLDMRTLAGVLAYESTELVVTARAGTPLAELEALLSEKQQYLPFDPPHLGPHATVGGMVAAGLSGPARANVGAVRDYVLGADMINGQGQWLRYGGQVMKNVAGYDISRLLAGSWGQLGVITQVSLKVLPMAPAETTLAFECEQADALARLHAWRAQPLPLNASSWFVDAGGPRLLVRLRGAAAAVQAACQRMGGQRLADADARAHWRDCREQRLSWFAQRSSGQALWRLSLPPTAPVLALPGGVGTPLIEWHGGQRWVQADMAHAQALHTLAQAAGGYASIFIATNAHQLSGNGHFSLKNEVLDALNTRVRQAFDPAGVFGTAPGAAR